MTGSPQTSQASMKELGEIWARHAVSREEAYRALTESRGLLHMGSLAFLKVSGKDAAGFLQGMTSQDIRGIRQNEAAASWVLDANGKIISLIYIAHMEDSGYLVQAPAGMATRLHKHLMRYVIMEDVVIEAAGHYACLSLQGPCAAATRAQCDGLDAAQVPHDRCGFGGFDLVCDRDRVRSVAGTLLEGGIVPVGADALEQARIEAFIPWFGKELLPC